MRHSQTNPTTAKAILDVSPRQREDFMSLQNNNLESRF